MTAPGDEAAIRDLTRASAEENVRMIQETLTRTYTGYSGGWKVPWTAAEDALAALDRLVAELETRRARVLPDDEVCSCLDETGRRTVRLYGRCDRCGAFMVEDGIIDELEACREALATAETAAKRWKSDYMLLQGTNKRLMAVLATAERERDVANEQRDNVYRRLISERVEQERLRRVAIREEDLANTSLQRQLAAEARAERYRAALERIALGIEGRERDPREDERGRFGMQADWYLAEKALGRVDEAAPSEPEDESAGQSGRASGAGALPGEAKSESSGRLASGSLGAVVGEHEAPRQQSEEQDLGGERSSPSGGQRDV